MTHKRLELRCPLTFLAPTSAKSNQAQLAILVVCSSHNFANSSNQTQLDWEVDFLEENLKAIEHK